MGPIDNTAAEKTEGQGLKPIPPQMAEDPGEHAVKPVSAVCFHQSVNEGDLHNQGNSIERKEIGAIDMTKKTDNRGTGQKGFTVAGGGPMGPSREGTFGRQRIDEPTDIKDRLDQAHAALFEMSGGRPRAAHQSSAAPGGTQQNPSAFEVKTDLFKAYILESADPNVTIVTLEGRIEQDQKKHFEDFFDRFVMQEGQTFLCDMKGLLSINSAGWGVMVAQFQRLKKHGGRFCLCGMRAEVDQCFQVLELHKLFPAFRSVSDALRSIDHEKENDASIMKTKTPWAGESQEKKSTLLLDDKIRRIIADHPGASAGKISKMLKSEEYGKVKIGLWTLQAKLRSMNLGTKDERFRYFRSS